MPSPAQQIATKLSYLWILLLMLLAGVAAAQQADPMLAQQGSKYLRIHIAALNKYQQRVDRQQKRLLTRLKRKEARFAKQLKDRDSAAYVRYREQPLSFDSISRLAGNDSLAANSRLAGKPNAITDSLKRIATFVQPASGSSPVAGSDYTAKLSEEQAKLNYHDYINKLIAQRETGLKSLASSLKEKLPAMGRISQSIYYAKSRMSAYKQLANDPDAAEQKALEYLQGTPGFDKAVAGSTGSTGSDGAMSDAALQQMGYQTKSQVNDALQQRFGNQTGQAAQSMGSQIKQWQDKAAGITSSISDAKQSIATAKNLKGNIHKPEFHINPMRGLPFRERLEKSYSLQASRANGSQPAILEGAATIGFRHTPRLSYGLGIAADAGLGKSFTQVHLSFQGIGLRSYVQWKWQYGIGVYGDYERTYKQALFKSSTANAEVPFVPSTHDKQDWKESVLLGLTKSYRISAKYNGAVQLLYDFWWQDKGLRSPFVLRFTTTTK